jgi:hypothetical protein
MIEVREVPGGEQPAFEVTVSEGRGSTTHRVTVSPELARRLAGSLDTAALVEASFRFLLDREPKESILRSFELGVIARYFPEFERELPRYLAG